MERAAGALARARLGAAHGAEHDGCERRVRMAGDVACVVDARLRVEGCIHGMHMQHADAGV